MQFSLFEKSLPEIAVPSALRQKPKIDLHRHLLGSVSPEIFMTVAKAYGLPLPATSIDELEHLLTIREPVDGLQPYFRPWSLLSKLLVNPEVLSDLVYLVLRDAHDDNVVYVELRATWGMTGKEPFSVKDFLAGLQGGLGRAEQEHGVFGRIIFGITRHLFARHQLQQRNRLWHTIIDAVNHYKHTIVVGFDLSGVEAGYPPGLFRDEFQEVRRNGFPITIHCGETTGVQDIWEAIEILRPSRLSHALKVVLDERLLQNLASSQTPIEVCPVSNWLTRTVADLSKHPVKEMHASGLKLTINTDNPAINRSDLTKEYALLMSKMDFTSTDLDKFMMNSVSSMFGDLSLRRKIEERYPWPSGTM
jgi:adenosine deaminase